MSPTPYDSQLSRRAKWLPRGNTRPAGVRVMQKLTSAMMKKQPDGVETIDTGQVRIRLHRPHTAATLGPAMLWIHGGGLLIGSPAQDDALCADLAQRAGCAIAAVEYRLAPQHPYPAALDDCYAGLQWLAQQPFVDPARLAVGGASAGGGLAAAVTLLARERGGPALAMQSLSYPMLDDRTAARTDIDQTYLRLWNNRSNAYGWSSYTGRPPGHPAVPALASPARAEDLTGLPPAWIGIGTVDLFFEECVAYANRLVDAGIDCDLHVAQGAFHGFDGACPRAGVSQAYRDSQLAALRRFLTVTREQHRPAHAQGPGDRPDGPEPKP